ncbi:Similar to Nucleoporin nup146; acc. no. Q09847 [Pyronema omphalodes CBS 100304]|uniref:Similar to Nucleoporin nup146 acc. no. Q09847 n=1 Tax=Pyronema omphalodes (strain CBS 100304) TaxID=1076935 RepID=U4LUU4_PYROM|nr:Similar to Nucleoporin nup146; acc. no. Q09847 [Pyronema omphalodes CBS 100304]
MNSNPYAVLSGSQETGNVDVELVGEKEPLDLECESLGFLGLNRDKRVKVLPEGFNKTELPHSCSSLFAVASKRGLFAAAGPKSFVIGSTQSLRDAFTKDEEFKPQLCIPSVNSISHIVFNADESHIILGDNEGRLTVYSIDALSSGNEAKATFELSAENELREVKPNPKAPELVAVVTMMGSVRMLDLNTRSFKVGPNGPSLLETVCTVAWSKMGKQIICGMGDGSLYQMTPEGVGKATLPTPPETKGFFVSSVLWLENNLFIITHSPLPIESVSVDSKFHILERKGNKLEYSTLYDPAPPYGMDERVPPYYFTAQVSQYAPALKNLIIFAGTCAIDIGVMARFSEDKGEIPANTFVTVNIPNDNRRAQLPLSIADKTDTSPIGMALDLSATAKVKRPVGGEEIDESPGPLPILMVLNYEGLVSAWHIIYDDAIQAGENYSGMNVFDTESAPAPQVQAAPSGFAPGTPGFGQSNFAASTGPASAFKPATPGFGVSAFGASTSGSGFGQPAQLGSSTSAFGQPSALGSSTTSGFGQSAFGSPSPMGAAKPAFGAPSVLGGNAPAFGSTSALGGASPAPAFGKPAFGAASPMGGASATPAFGQTSAFGKPAFGQVSPFGAPAAAATPAAGASQFGGGGGFASFANKGGFAAAASAGGNNTASPFGKGGAIPTQSQEESVFKKVEAAPAFGQAGFQLSSGFKADPSQMEGEEFDTKEGGSLGGFGSILGGALDSKPAASAFGAPEAVVNPFGTPKYAPTANPFGTPANPPNPSAFNSSTSSAAIGTGIGSAFSKSTDTNPFNRPTSGTPSQIKSAFGTPSQITPAFGVPSTPTNPAAKSSAPAAPLYSEDEEGDVEVVEEEEAALPPDFTTPGNTTEPQLPDAPLSSEDEETDDEAVEEEEAALPPDFTTPGNTTEPQLPAAPLCSEDKEHGAGDKGGEEDLVGYVDETEWDVESEEDSDAENKPPAITPKKSPSTLLPPTTPAKSAKSTAATPASTKSNSSVFGGNASFSSTFGSTPANTSNPFSSLKPNPEDILSDEEHDDDDEDDDDDEESEEEVKPARQLKGKTPQKTPQKAKVTPISAKMEARAAAFMGLDEKGKKKDDPLTPSAQLLSENKSGLFGGKSTEAAKPAGSLFAAKTASAEEKKPAGGLFVPTMKLEENKKPGLFDSPGSPATAQKANPLGTPPAAATSPEAGKKFVLPSKPAASPLRAAPRHKPSPAPRPAAWDPEPKAPKEPEQPKPEPVDFDRDYSDTEDDYIRQQLQRGPIKPSTTLPEVCKLVEPELDDDFDLVFDSLYQSGNMMVNKLGQMSRALRSYHLAQKTPPPILHNDCKKIGKPEEWRLCESSLVTKEIGTLLKEAQEINKATPELQKLHSKAAKGFIKLDTSESELYRLFAVYTDPNAAARARARLLAPEQQIQQRQLRKSFSRVEKSLKEVESKTTVLKAKLAARDRGRKTARVRPPTAEAVRNTVLKLTQMAERKERDVALLEERMRRLKLRHGRDATPTPASGDSTTGGGADQSAQFGSSFFGSSMGSFVREGSAGLETPLRRSVLTVREGSPMPTIAVAKVEEQEVGEMMDEAKRRREQGKRFKEAMKRRGQKVKA